jgi:stage V sporulation protein D (sporulation-specific penicillin-binding protein)
LGPSDPNGSVASFIGVAPIDDPQIAVIVILDDPHNPVSNYGSVIAAPVAGDIFSKILPYLGVEPQYTDAELQSLEIKTPDLTSKSVADAKSILSGAGLKINVTGSGQTITSQSPAAGIGIPQNGTIVVYTGNAAAQNSTVPQLSGLTPDQVAIALSAANLNVIYGGLAQDATDETAYSQNYAQGTKVAIGTVITVNFRDNKLSVN